MSTASAGKQVEVWLAHSVIPHRLLSKAACTDQELAASTHGPDAYRMRFA